MEWQYRKRAVVEETHTLSGIKWIWLSQVGDDIQNEKKNSAGKNEFLMSPRFNLVTKWFDCTHEQWIYTNRFSLKVFNLATHE